MSEEEVSIFRVPESLRELRPAAYSPWLIGLGPLHHFEPRLYKVEPFKLAVAKSGLQRFNIPDFGSLVRRLDPLLPRIRACYSPNDVRLLSPTLGWTMAIDGLFLLELLCDLDGIISRLCSSPAAAAALPLDDCDRFSFLGLYTVTTVHSAARWTPPVHSMVLNDVVLLENQIPVSILAEAVSYFSAGVYQVLNRNLESLCSFVSPLPRHPGAINPYNHSSSVDDQERLPPAHLLDYLYSSIIGGGGGGGGGGASGRSPAVILDLIDNLEIHAEISQHVFPPDWTRTGPADEHHAAVARPFPFFRSIFRGAEMEAGSHYTLESIIARFCGQVPSATNLHLCGGLKFQGKTGDLRIEFDDENRTISVPLFKWNLHSEVVVRNLVAYEAITTKSSPPNDDIPLTQYVHFMHMVLCTAGDVALLIDAGVIVDSPREESGRIRDTFRSLCTCRISGSKVTEGKLVDDSLRRRLNRRGDDHAYGGVRSYYTRRRGQILVQKYAALLYLAFCFGLAYLVVAGASLSLGCGFVKKLLGSGGSGDCSGSCVADIATFVAGRTKQLDI